MAGSSAVHPRACGEHRRRRFRCVLARGSSPRMRGTLVDFVGGDGDGRFIPAHAGNTACPNTDPGTPPVHPRACGEHHHRVHLVRVVDGSSPRMRGTLGQGNIALAPVRFIPAHAGNTLAQPAPGQAPPVHPRACGEHYVFQAPPLLRAGSSPRMRGTPPAQTSHSELGRFIPAHAGNTHSFAATPRAAAVHPRACGEHRDTGIGTGIGTGSSPRMRGTPPPLRRMGRVTRFIPAHAGNTVPRRPERKKSTVHPRACGEHRRFFAVASSLFGSSPRMRGTRAA